MARHASKGLRIALLLVLALAALPAWAEYWEAPETIAEGRFPSFFATKAGPLLIWQESQSAGEAGKAWIRFARNEGGRWIRGDVSDSAYSYSSTGATPILYSAAQSRNERGIATTIEVAQAKQQVAQAALGLVESQGFERDDYHALLKAMGVAPTLAIKVQDVAGRPLPRAPVLDLDRLVEAALRRRPDAQAAFARMKADQSNVDRARSDFLPRIAATGALDRNIGQASATDTLTSLTTRTRVDATNADAFLLLSVPIYDGGVRDAQLRAAEAQASAAANELSEIQNAGAQEIVAAYDALRTSLAAFAAASELVVASKVTAAAARDYYDHGLGTLTDATSAQTALLQAELAKAKAHSDALTAAATIAFASGALTNRDTLGAR